MLAWVLSGNITKLENPGCAGIFVEVNMKVFSGSTLFELKATHGIPFDITLQNVLQKGYVVDWVDFIECARKNKWYDFQTMDAIIFVLQDVISDKNEVQEIISRMKLYITNNRHPMLCSEEKR